MICLLFASDDVYQESTTNSLLSVECWQPIAQQYICLAINVEICY